MGKNLFKNLLYNRQRELLGIIEELSNSGKKSKTFLMKTLFLLKKEYGATKYDFFSYNFGPYSKTVYWDLDYLKKEDLINKNETELTSKGKKEIRISENTKEKLKEIIKQFKTNKQIIDYVYDRYPEYTEKSKLITHKQIKSKGKYTIGYEGISIDLFMDKLIQNKVTKLIDVRKNAFSMKRGFSKNKLKETLEKAGIEYIHIPKLGIESNKRQKLETKEDYEKLFKQYKKSLSKRKNELEYVKKQGTKNRIAIMCFEKDPCYCHRGQISNYLGEFLHL